MQSLRQLTLVLSTLGALALAGCSSVPPSGPPGNGATPDGGGTDAVTGTDGDPSPDSGQTSSALTYHKDVRPIVEKNCQGCHVPGGIGPFPLTSYDEVKAQIAKMVVATQAGLMPPWLPADDCRPLHGSRKLSDADVQTLADWKKAGTPEGDPRDAPAPFVPAVIPEPDMKVAMPGRYLPKQDTTDDYHCFVLDPNFTEDQYVTGFIANPGNKALVHHVLLFIADPDNVPTVDALDAAEEGPGYTCFGAAGFQPSGGTSLIVGGWAPGAGPTMMPEGTGIKIPAGSKLVLQMHYNVPNAPGTDDLSDVGLYMARPGQVMTEAIQLPFAPFRANPDTGNIEPWLEIEAGNPQAVVKVDFPLPAEFRMYGTGPHMHLRGRTFNLKMIRQDGTQECLIDVPQWDFHWQGGYAFEEPIDFHQGDRLVQTCTYDNSAGAQPLGPDGKPMPVTDVTWGERTVDEMCLSFSVVTAIPQ